MFAVGCHVPVSIAVVLFTRRAHRRSDLSGALPRGASARQWCSLGSRRRRWGTLPSMMKRFDTSHDFPHGFTTDCAGSGPCGRYRAGAKQGGVAQSRLREVVDLHIEGVDGCREILGAVDRKIHHAPVVWVEFIEIFGAGMPLLSVAVSESVTRFSAIGRSSPTRSMPNP